MIRREIITRLKSLLFWTLGFVFMIIGGMTKFDTFANGGNGQQLNEFVRSMPRIMRVIYGMENVDIGTFEGYFGLLMLYVLIMTAVHGAFLGASLIHLEIKERTADFLFVKPMSRDQILLRKLLGGLGLILILNAIITACYFYVFSQTDKLSLLPGTILATALTHLFFFALGFSLTILLPKSKYGQQASLIVILISYLSISLSQLYNQPWILNISPIGWYYNNLYRVSITQFILVSILIAGLTLLLLGGGIYRFRSRDIPN